MVLNGYCEKKYFSQVGFDEERFGQGGHGDFPIEVNNYNCSVIGWLEH